MGDRHGAARDLKPHARTEFAAGLFSALRARFRSARLVAADCYFGGMHYIEYAGEDFLRNYPELDAVVKYEGEAALADLLAVSPRGAARVSRGRAAQISPDELPYPAWDLISVEGYYAFCERFLAARGRAKPFDRSLPTLPAVTSRGCPYRCAFCTANPGEERALFRPHSPAYLAGYFAALKDRFGARRLALLDGCPNCDEERFAEILAVIGKLGLSCEFPNGLRADKLSRGTLKALRGLSEAVTISAESADPEVLRRQVRKGLKIESVERVAAWCRELRLPLNVHYVVGLPGETVAGVNRTLAHALRLKEELGARPLVQNFVPIPGAPLHEACRRGGLLRHFDAENIYPYFQGPPAVETPALTRAQLAGMRELFERRLAAGALEKVIVNLTYECSNDCRFCAVGDRRRRHGDLGRHCRVLREYRRKGATALDIDGGEPTLHPGFFPFVRLARRLGYESVTVTTNGRRLADRAFASRFLLGGVNNVLISLHGHTPEIHDYHTRRPGSFEETVRGIRHAVRLRPGRVSLAVNTVITGRNAHKISEFFGFVRALGVEKVNVQFVTPFGSAAAGPAEDMQRLGAPLAEAVSRWRRDLRIELVNAIPCRLAKYFPEIKPEVGKNSRDMAFADAPPENLAAYLAAKRLKTEACQGCEFSIGCAGFYVFGEARPPR